MRPLLLAIAVAGCLAAAPGCRPLDRHPGGLTGPDSPPGDLPDGPGPAPADSIYAQAVLDAQAIRDGAGIPPGEVVGVRPGAEPGVRADRVLKPTGPIVLRSREDALALADGGTGTAEDPFRFERRLIEPSSDPPPDHGFDWRDPNGDYYVRVEDVVIRGFAVAQVRVNVATSLTLAHATLTGGRAGGAGLYVGEGTVVAREVELSGLAGDGVRTIGTQPCTVQLVDCRWNERYGKWGSGAVGVRSRNTGGDAAIEIEQGELVAPSLRFAIRDWDDGVLVVRNCDIRTEAGYEAKNRAFTRLTFLNNRFTVERAPFYADSLLSDWEIAYNDFDDSGDGYRLCRLDNARDGIVHHNRFTKTQGELPANECLEGFDCADVVFEYNWVTECTEDAYEHVRPRGGCVVRHCVADQVRGQVVDYFGNHPENGGEIHHVYGDCRDIGVIVTDVDNLFVHDIFTDNTASLGNEQNIRLEQRHTVPGEHPAGCTFLPPLPRVEDSYQGVVFGTWGTVGPGNHAEWWENGGLRTFSS